MSPTTILSDLVSSMLPFFLSAAHAGIQHLVVLCSVTSSTCPWKNSLLGLSWAFLCWKSDKPGSLMRFSSLNLNPWTQCSADVLCYLDKSKPVPHPAVNPHSVSLPLGWASLSLQLNDHEENIALTPQEGRAPTIPLESPGSFFMSLSQSSISTHLLVQTNTIIPEDHLQTLSWKLTTEKSTWSTVEESPVLSSVPKKKPIGFNTGFVWLYPFPTAILQTWAFVSYSLPWQITTNLEA